MHMSRGRIRPRRSSIALAAGLAALAAGVLAPMTTASAATAGPGLTRLDPTLARELLAKAPVDECYDPSTGASVMFPDGGGCPEGTVPKANQSYVWGLTQSGDTLWFGTASNYMCMGADFISYLGGVTFPPIKTDKIVCQAPAPADSSIPALGGPADWRPPHVYSYNLRTRVLTDRTPTAADNPDALDLINQTEGLRSAGSLGDVVFLAGPLLVNGANPTGGVSVFAYSSSTGKLLGATKTTQFTNVRAWLTAGKNIYVGMMSASTGVVLKWVGTATDPFAAGGFEPIGTLPEDAGGPAEMAFDPVTGRIVVTTWNYPFDPANPSNVRLTTGSGVWVSGAAHRDGAFTADDNQVEWKQLWSPSSYEPDAALVMSYMGGGIAAFGGQVYWGTINVPMSSLMTYMVARGYPKYYNPTDNIPDLLMAAALTTRPATVWRAGNLNRLFTGSVDPKGVLPGQTGNVPTVQLLYGESVLPAYTGYLLPLGVSAEQLPTTGWTLRQTGWTPRYGHSGFGNPLNAYMWSMATYAGKLYVGTFDATGPILEGAKSMLSMLGLTEEQLSQYEALVAFLPGLLRTLPIGQLITDQMLQTFLESVTGIIGAAGGIANYLVQQFLGADLARFDNGSSPAVFEDISGLGNNLNYGVRTMVSDKNGLYVGTANAMNIAGPLSADGEHIKGGWELIGLHTSGGKPKR